MPMRAQIVVVYNAIPSLIAHVEAESRSAVKKYADEVVRRARMYAPVDTGYLRSSIQAVSITAGKEAEVVVGAYYGAYVEYGTYKMTARPFLYPAMTEVAPEYFAEVGKWFARF